MKKVFNFFWKNKFTIIILLLIIYLTLLGLEQEVSEKQVTLATPTPIKIGTAYKEITPGINSLEDVKRELGNPLSEKSDGERQILEYESSSPIRRHEVIAEKSNTVFIKEIVTAKDNIKSQDLLQKHGTPDHMLYDQSSYDSAFNLYVYPNLGLAYVGHEDGTILEIWYFIPTDINQFIINWASNYAFTRSTIQVQ